MTSANPYVDYYLLAATLADAKSYVGRHPKLADCPVVTPRSWKRLPGHGVRGFMVTDAFAEMNSDASRKALRRMSIHLRVSLRIGLD